MKQLLLFSVLLSPLFASSQWQASKGPYGGNVLAFCEYNDALYAGTSAGLFASTDNGDNWKFIDVGSPISASAIAQMGGRIFVGTQGEGIYSSSDKGISWQKLNSGLSTYYRFCGYCIQGFSVIGNKIFAGTGDGLFKLENNDTIWGYVPGGGSYNDAFSSNGSIIVSSEWTRYGPGSSSKISTDGGATFRFMNFPGPYNDRRDLAYSFDVTSYGIFAVTSTDLYRSTDNGLTWGVLYHGTGDYRPTFVKAIGDTIYLATDGKGLLISKVNNISWSNYGFQNMSVSALIKHNHILFAGIWYSRGIFSKTGNNNWLEKNNGLTAMNIHSIESSGSFIVAGCNGGVMISKDTGYTWVRHDLRLPGKPYDRDNDFNIEALATNGKIILAGTPKIYPGVNQNVFFSLDSGETWSVMNQSFNYELAGLAIIGNRFIVCAWGAFYYSDDHGKTWQTGQLPGAGNYAWIELSSNAKELYISGYGQGGKGNISTSKDSGTTWNTVSKPSAIGIAFLQATDSLLFAQDLSTGLFVGSTDGSSWYRSDTIPLGNPTIGIKGHDVFIADRYVVPDFMHSSDLGHTWAKELLFGNHKIEQLGSSKYFAFASVPGFGIWRYGSQNEIPSVIAKNSKSNNFQVFPNPSSGKFTIESPEKISSIEITNLIGEKVYSSTVNNKQETINLSGAIGIYFVEIISGNTRSTKKIVLQ